MIAMATGKWPQVDPTPGQVKLSEFYMRFRAKHGYSPTLRDICDGMRLKKTWVCELVSGLIDLGLYERDVRKRRSLKLTRDGEEFHRTLSNTDTNTGTKTGRNTGVT